MPPKFIAYHGKTSSEHQQQFNSLSSQGFRIISLSVYGDPSDPRYAAVWVERTGSAWVGVHGVDATGYQNFFNTWTAKGFAPIIVSVTGLGSNAIFAAVFEKGANAAGWFAKHGLIYGDDANPNTFEHYCKFAQDNGYYLISAAIYGGDQANRLYAGIWARYANNNPIQWHYHPADTANDYQTWFNAETQLPFRLSYIALSSAADHSYLSIFRDDSVGDWVARHGMTANDYQTAFNQLTANGYYPICVQGGGAGADTRYAALFAKQDIPYSRQWTITGQPVPELAAFDDAMKNHMQREGIRAGVLAISKNGVLKFARAYTWAEPGYPATQPSSLFRLASVSKMFTSAAIKTLYDSQKLHPSDKVFPLLGISSPLPQQQQNQTPIIIDPRINTITVQNLVDHLGGWIQNQTYDPAVSSSPFDPVFAMRGIALRLGLPGALTKMDLARYMYGQPLQFSPGTPQPSNVSTYSNFGYVLLGMLVEKVSGQKFIDYVKQNVLSPLGINDVYQAHTLRNQRASNEVASYDDPGLGLSAADPHANSLVPYAYGGEGWMTEVMDSGGGLMATATALTQVARHYLTWGVGLRPGAGNWWLGRTGGMAGTSSLVASRGVDGVDYAFIFNTRHDAPGVHDDLGATIDQLLNTNPLP